MQSMPVEGSDFFVKMVPFPAGKIHGAVTPNSDGTFTMYIDINAPADVQEAAYWHEYQHIAFDDFYSNKPIEEIEDI